MRDQALGPCQSHIEHDPGQRMSQSSTVNLLYMCLLFCVYKCVCVLYCVCMCACVCVCVVLCVFVLGQYEV